MITYCSCLSYEKIAGYVATALLGLGAAVFFVMLAITDRRNTDRRNNQ